jgi:flagellin
MALMINFNQSSLAAQRHVSGAQSIFQAAIEKLSSGVRINKAADDSAGLAVSEKLKNQVRGLNQAQRNAQDSISLLQTAEGALNEVHSLLGRVRELAVQSANDTLTNSDRTHIQDEVDALLSEVDRIGAATQFNTINLLNSASANGTFGYTFHVGANFDDGTAAINEITFTIGSSAPSVVTGATDGQIDTSTLDLAAIKTNGPTNVTAQSVANSAISRLDTAIEAISTYRGAIGAMQNRLTSQINSLGVASENVGAANSRIRDADIAQAVSEMTRAQILQQASMAVLAQANQQPQSVLQLLK